MPISLAGIPCNPKPVLTPYEQTLFNVCEEYFYLNQNSPNRCPVLSQVRLCDVIDVDKDGSFIADVQFNALSFDIVVTDSVSNPLFIFEADGVEHRKNNRRMKCDQVKNAIVTKARIPLFRWDNDGVYEHVDVVRARADFYPVFSRDAGYPTDVGHVTYDRTNYPNAHRTIEPVDIELMLIKHGWKFPADWVYVTGYPLREYHIQEPRP